MSSCKNEVIPTQKIQLDLLNNYFEPIDSLDINEVKVREPLSVGAIYSIEIKREAINRLYFYTKSDLIISANLQVDPKTNKIRIILDKRGKVSFALR